MEELRTVVNIMALLGIPSLFACSAYFAKACVKFSRKIDTLISAQQKQMRRDLMSDYHKYMGQGYITDEDLDTWEAAYQAYHNLGLNGILDTRRDDLFELPNEAHD